MNLGTIKDYTPNFNLIIPEFNISGWHDYLEENFRSIDALFYNLFGINNYNGIWKKLTSYTAGQVVFIGEDDNYSGRLVKVLVDHTTTNDDFSTFFENNPTYYELFADASTAQYYAIQAKDWATKTDGPVEGTSYSSKYYADIVNSLSTEITSLYNIINDLQTVANISTDIENVADNETNINTVASNNANITAVAQDLTNINAVNSNKTNIDTTATNISSINIAASNITAIQNASTYATNASNSADLAKQYAIGDPSEPTGNSAKYWADKTSSELSTLESNVSAIQANYATTNTNQTISGQKTFTSTPRRTSTINLTATTGQTEVTTLTTLDKNNQTFSSFNSCRSSTTNYVQQRIVNRNLESTSNWFDIRANITDSGNGYVNIACGSGVTNYNLSYATNSTSSTYLAPMGWVNNPSASTNVVHRSGDETITSTKTFTTEQKFNNASNTTTKGLSIVPYTSGTADIGLRDTSNNWLGRLFFNSSGILQLSGTSVTSITPTEDTTSSTQIDTVGARNTKLGSMFQVVSALPANPDPDTFYFIPES